MLELIPTPETKPAVLEAVRDFADHHLGKGVVVAKDTPNFIGNHIALYGVARTLDAVASGKYTRNVVPFPGSVVTAMCPPLCVTMP